MARRSTALLGLAAALAFLGLLAATVVVGPVALVPPLIAVGAIWLIVHPGWAVGVAVGAVVVVERQADWGPSTLPARLYDYLPGAKLTGAEALLVLAVIAVVLHRRGRPGGLLLPWGFGLPLTLLALGLMSGVITGHTSGAGTDAILNAGRTALPVVLMPLLIVQVVEDRAGLRRALLVAAVLAIFKGLAGLAALATGLTGASVGEPLTYFESPANTLMMLFCCVVLALAVMRVHGVPGWVWALFPLVLASLTLSYRRSFWIAMAAGALVVLLVGVGRDMRTFGAPIAAATAIAVILALSSTGSGDRLADASVGSGSGSGGEFSLAARLKSINPTSIASSRDDRYRIGERRNVLADLRESPISGIGLGISWTARYPLSIGDITREYVHVGALWWWMKCGVLGLIGYVWLLGAALLAGMRTRRGHPDALVRAAGLGSVGALIGYALAELTGTFSGADQRASVLLGTWIGLLAVAAAQATREPAPPAAITPPVPV